MRQTAARGEGPECGTGYGLGAPIDPKTEQGLSTPHTSIKACGLPVLGALYRAGQKMGAGGGEKGDPRRGEKAQRGMGREDERRVGSGGREVGVGVLD